MEIPLVVRDHCSSCFSRSKQRRPFSKDLIIFLLLWLKNCFFVAIPHSLSSVIHVRTVSLNILFRPGGWQKQCLWIKYILYNCCCYIYLIFWSSFQPICWSFNFPHLWIRAKFSSFLIVYSSYFTQKKEFHIFSGIAWSGYQVCDVDPSHSGSPLYFICLHYIY